MKRVLVLVFAVILVALPVVTACSAGAPEAKPIKLRGAHWSVPTHPDVPVLQQIGADLKQATGGLVTMDLTFGTLGKPAEYYDAVVGGLGDMAQVVTSYTPGRFPISEMFMLPIAFPDNVSTSKALVELLKKGYFDKEFSEIKLVSFGFIPSYAFQMRKGKPIATLADFKGKKIATPSAVGTAMVEAIGGVPVGMPVTDLYQAMQTGVIDGALQSLISLKLFKLSEVTESVTQEKQMRSGVVTIIAMNKNAYASLPKEAKAVIDANVEKYSIMTGQAMQNATDDGIKAMTGAGGKIVSLSAAESAEMGRLFKPIFNKWIADSKAKAIPAEKSLDELFSTLQKLGVQEPFAR